MLHDLSRSLRHYWRTSLALIAGAGLATSVVAGALLVGDSVRASLRRLTEERLGEIDFALAGQRFFPERAVAQLAKELDSPVAPAILLRGSAQHATSRARASQVGLYGVDERFFALYSGRPVAESPWANEKGLFPPVWLNRSLAEALGAKVGDAVLISLRRIQEVPDGSLLAREDTASVLGTLRLQVSAILPDEGLGSFELGAHQSQSLNAFLPMAAAQKALEQAGKVNAILVSDTRQRSSATGATQRAESLTAQLDRVLGLEDLAVQLTERGAYLELVSGEYVVRPALGEAATRVTSQLGASAFPYLSYLVNRFEKGDRRVPYSTAAAVGPSPAHGPGGTGGLLELAGQPLLGPIGPRHLVLNQWLAEELEARPGDRIQLHYFEIGEREELREVTRELEVAGVVAMQELGADPGLTQEYPGIAGSDNMADWDPPFPIELGRIRKVDEDYWDQYRGAPKAFVDLELGQEMWGNRWGRLSGLRILPPPGEPLATFTPRFRTALREALPAAAFGLRFEPVRALGLQAAGGATDFGGLFFGLSLFVIAAAALLIALLTSLMVEQRAGEIGLRQAVGFAPKQVRRHLWAEGFLLTAVGVVLGLAGAVAYGGAMMWGLRTFWRPAVGTSRLELTVTPTALVGGAVIALVVALLAIYLSLRRVGQVSTPQLLRRNVTPRVRRGGRRGQVVAWSLGLVAVLTIAAGLAGQKALFPLAGLALLGSALAGAGRFIDRERASSLADGGPLALFELALANTRRERRRSLLALALVALATFLVVMVAAFEVDFRDSALGRESGAGGFSLVAEAVTPLQADLSHADGRAELGLDEALFEEAQIWPLRVLPGDDTSCLNLYQPTQPRLLGLPADLRARGGFSFTQSVEKRDNPWELLDLDLGEDVIPVIGDANSTQWILKLPLGGELPIRNEAGKTVRLRLVANLATSIFQGELLVAEHQFLRHFPSHGGFAAFLIESPRPEPLGLALEAGLDRYGFDVEKVGDRLAAFHAVQNTYLSTFRSLGGLGLLLGTLGLATVLVRNVLERRGELAALRAFGFRRQLLVRLVLWENLALLAGGLVIGTVAALVAAAGNLLDHPGQAPWLAIASTLLGIAVFGLLACWVATRGALSSPLIPALKAE